MKTTYRTLSEFKEEVMRSDELRTQLQTDPKALMQSLEISKPLNNPKVFRSIIYIIGFALILSIIAIAVIVLVGPIKVGSVEQVREIPEIFGVIASACIAAIAGLLAPSPMQQKETA